MNIYIDFDDCLCETARYFSDLVKEMFGKDIPYENISYFELDKSFSLTEEQFVKMMTEAHTPEALLSIEETPGASETVNKWIDSGHEVFVITGRPYNAYDASRKWLDQHGLERVTLYCLNKYGHDAFYKKNSFSLELEDYYKMHFDVAIEDSPLAFRFFDHLPDLKVMVLDRPWNKKSELPGENYHRCFDWKMIKLDDYEIVKATETDRDDIMSLYNMQKGQEFCPWNEDYPSNETIDFDLSRDALYVLKVEGVIKAAISLEEDEAVDELSCWSEELTPVGELARLAVLPEEQSKGWGRIMLYFGMEELKRRGHKGIHFLVNKYNIKAIRCYETFGFDKVGECHMYDQYFLCYEKEL